jgi:hypothetical protein
MFATLALCLLALHSSIQEPASSPDPPNTSQRDVRAALAARVELLRERAGWERILFDDRWNQGGPSSAGIDGVANVRAVQERDVSFVNLPVGYGEPRVVTGLEVYCQSAGHSEVPFVITELRVFASPTRREPVAARRVRIQLPNGQIRARITELHLRGDRDEVIRFETGAPSEPSASGTLALSPTEENPEWEVRLASAIAISGVVIVYDPADVEHVDGYVVRLLGEDDAEVWRSAPTAALGRPVEIGPTCWQPLHVVAHSASSFGPGSELVRALAPIPDERVGWSPTAGRDRAFAVLALPKLPHVSTMLRVELHQNHGGGRVLGRFGVEVTSSRDLAPPIPVEILELIDRDRSTRQWTDEQRRLALRFLRATQYPTDPWVLSDADLIARARLAVEAPDVGVEVTRIVDAISARPFVGISGIERIELAAFLVDVGR